MKYGSPAAGASELGRLVQDARAKGFDLVARKASERLGASQAMSQAKS
jgi:hypothetical protein